MLGFSILLRDRRREERSQAALIVCWSQTLNAIETVRILNSSSRPVSNIIVFAHNPHIADEYVPSATRWEGFVAKEILMSQELCEGLNFVTEPIDGRWFPRYITFVDVNGSRWIRFLGTGFLVKAPRKNRPSSFNKLEREDVRRWLKSEYG